jgi:2,4-dienoyl-CoA reductase-like NADH-dependent reductase (Old Yellow Enzyme family)
MKPKAKNFSRQTGDTEMMFEPISINGMQLKNRFVRSATWEGMAAEDGASTPALTDLMVRLAQGGLGLIISSHAYVKKEGQAGPQQIGIYSDDLMDGYRKMTAAVHDHGGKIVLQIAHAGVFAYTKLTGQAPVGLSHVEGIVREPIRELSPEDIRDIVAAFALAGGRAKSAGFDGVQIHAAHGYLLSQSLSPLFNKRQDAYGQSVENRSRFLMEVLRSVRSTVGPGFPILIKMNCEDFVEGGLTLQDSLQVGRMLQENGIDAIELSGGILTSKELSPSRTKITNAEKEAYFRDGAKAFKQQIGVPLILVGGIRSFEVAEMLVREEYADCVSMSRPLIREPDLVKRWQSGDRRKATCISDNQCFFGARSGEGIYCMVERKQRLSHQDTKAQ